MSNALIMAPMAPVAATAISGTAAGSAANCALGEAADFFGMQWRSTGTTASIKLDMGANVAVDTLAILGASGAPSATWSLYYATAAQGAAMSGGVGTGANQYQQIDLGSFYAGANALASGAQAGLWIGASAVTARHFQINVASVSDGAFAVSRVAIGQRLRLERNFDYGAAFAVRDFSSVEYSNRAVLLRRQGKRLRAVGLSFENAYRDEVEAQIHPLIEQVGNDHPILLVIDPDAHAMRTRRIYFGHLEGDLGTIWRNAKGWQWRADLVSLFS